MTDIQVHTYLARIRVNVIFSLEEICYLPAHFACRRIMSKLMSNYFVLFWTFPRESEQIDYELWSLIIELHDQTKHLETNLTNIRHFVFRQF